MTLTQKLETYFEFKELGTNWRREILAGFSVFLSLAYIIVVNPTILAKGGIPLEIAFFATVAISGLAMIAMGLWARLPFVLAPGLEMNAYLVFFIIGVLGYSWQEALGLVFWSGVLFLILTLTRLRQGIIEAIPENMKYILSFAVGVFVAAIGLRITDLLFYDGSFISGVGDFISPKAITLYIGLGVLIILSKLRVPGAVLLSIFAGSLYLNLTAGVDDTANYGGFAEMTKDVGAFDPFFALKSRAAIGAIFVLFAIDFYGSIAKFIGLTVNTPIKIQERSGKALYVDSVATIFGAAAGTSSITTYVESAVGIGAGGRSGIVAIIAGVLMLASFFLLPYLSYVPVAATAPALLYVGYKLFPVAILKDKFRLFDWFVLAVSGLIVFFMFALDKAMLFGFACYFAMALFAKFKGQHSKDLNIYLFISILILLASMAF